MKHLTRRSWIPTDSENFIQSLVQRYAGYDSHGIETEIKSLIEENRRIHERECVNLNPATNVLNPKAEAALACGLGSRPSLGYPGNKYETGLEAIEKIEIIATALACEIFDARYAEIRVASGSMANLYAFMATCNPGDRIIVPPADIGGHVTHHDSGAAGLYGLEIHAAPVDPGTYSFDIDALQTKVKQLRPKLITVGGSLNLFPHPLQEIRQVADGVGAFILYDAAHVSGMIAGKAWQQPLEEGAHLMTMSTYKSLGGPPSGIIVTNDPQLAERLDKIAFPGLTANFDVAKSAALAISLLDWKKYGHDYAQMMAGTAHTLAKELSARDVPVFAAQNGFTTSHQFAVEAESFSGGQCVSKLLRRANILACGIGLPIDPLSGDLNGLRFGTPEIVRWGMEQDNMPELAEMIARVLIKGEPPENVARDVTAFRQCFQKLNYIRQ